MKDTRERTFFWLGVFVLPVFWSWFTICPSFTRGQRFAAFSWLALTIATITFQWSAVAEHMKLIGIGYMIIVGWVTVALFAWLCYRTGLFPLTLLEVFFGFVIFAPYAHHFMDPFYRAIGTPFDVHWLLAPFVLSLLHLVIGPLKRATRNIPYLFGYNENE